MASKVSDLLSLGWAKSLEGGRRGMMTAGADMVMGEVEARGETRQGEEVTREEVRTE